MVRKEKIKMLLSIDFRDNRTLKVTAAFGILSLLVILFQGANLNEQIKLANGYIEIYLMDLFFIILILCISILIGCYLYQKYHK